MRISSILFSLCFAFFLFQAKAQNHQQRFESLDVQHYRFEITINDDNNRIAGNTNILLHFLKKTNEIQLDLDAFDPSSGKGMKVEKVFANSAEAKFIQTKKQLLINSGKEINVGETLELTIEYSGVPADGLIIDQNRYGDRTFFGDNWPNRAHYWLPVVDHPSDKATLEFVVKAPGHYKVVSSGKLVEEKGLDNHQILTHWEEKVPLSTKVMVFGAADFAVGNDTVWNQIPVNSWVFKENREKGFRNYRYGTKALEYFSALIGPYSYEKLAHVQSKTRYGGMENAGCIFYNENSAISDKSQEDLFAHEVAHQWFGNSATEENWHHVWLSEGFATYLTHVYNQHFYGEEMFRNGLKKDRARVIGYFHRHPAPIIDTTVTEYIQLLNANSYQKASWFLHMLRHKLGDDVFFAGLRNYYCEYQNKTALTSDYRKVMEETSGENLESFFAQWLRQAGHPLIDWNWQQTSDKTIEINIKQTQKQALFSFPLELKLYYENGGFATFRIDVSDSTTQQVLQVSGNVRDIELDPEVKLLFEVAN
ncbi:M1 family metallopeptidase [Maribellus sp. CM-23]|uniref:M1 family metallopeptidase n=1 Tax=Maribellus sp. CM-23 TaxID=2781026 RepID=UPI001F1C83EC|nr:M1 family metallopeptidase [Maribellus sp. CM-23]MCE4564338.1 M1 family metallopeptidase [Maribellus sp. CM-23]